MSWRRLLGIGFERSKRGGHSGTSEALEAQLMSAMRWLSRAPDALTDMAHARMFLPNLPPRALLDVDERLRSYSSPVYASWPVDGVARIASNALDPASRQALLFLSAGHFDGRIREATLRRLPEFPGSLALAVALIRCADWTPAVRRAAQAATERLLSACLGDDVVALWPLILRLRGRERVDQSWFQAHVEAWMLRDDMRMWLLALLGSDNAAVRNWAIRRCLEEQVSLDFDLLDKAIRDPDPGIGLHALRYAQRSGDAARVRRLAETGLRAAHPVIRRESLRALSDLEGALTRVQLSVSLCDGAAGVRSLAAFLLRDRYAEDPLPVWRTVLDADGERPTLGALIALADRAQTEDAVRMSRWLDHRKSLVRAHALRGLIKAGVGLDEAQLIVLLDRGGNRVMRQLDAFVRSGDIPLAIERIEAIVSSPTTTAAARCHLRHLLEALEYWRRLALLLRFRAIEDFQREWWRDAVLDWIAECDAYAPLGAGMRVDLLRLLEGRREDMREGWYEAIRGAIERH